jgi:hypothetical protein
VAQQVAAQGRYALPPEGLVVERDLSRAVPCPLGHPPLLWRVRVIDTQTGERAYIGTGCCQTVFGKTPADVRAAQTEAEHRVARLQRYAPWLPVSEQLTETVEAIAYGALDPIR